MPERDYYPASMDGKVPWHLNLKAHIDDFVSKYSLDPAVVQQLKDDADWIAAWVPIRHGQDTLKQQVTKYFNTIAGKDEDAEVPADPNIAKISIPTAVKPGIEKRVRDFGRDLKNRANYAPADGEVLGFELPEKELESVDTLTAEFTIETQAEFKLKASFKKKGMDGMRFEYRRKGGAWNPAGVLITSPGSFTVPPETPGEAEQVEIRAVYIKANENTGNFSDAKSAFIAP